MTAEPATVLVPPAYAHVVVAVTASTFLEVAVRGAELMSHGTAAELHLVHVNAGEKTGERNVRHELEERVHAMRPDYEPEWLEGDLRHPAESIHEYLSGLDSSIGCVATHGYRGLELLLGSVTENLLLSGRPLIVFGPEGIPTTIRRAAVCLDGSARAEALIPEAVRWAAALHVPLWFVQAIDPSPQVREGDILETGYVHHEVRRWLPSGLDLEWEVVHDVHPDRALLRWLHEEPGTLTVAATHGSSGRKHALLGGMAHRLVHGCRGPLILQRT